MGCSGQFGILAECGFSNANISKANRTKRRRRRSLPAGATQTASPDQQRGPGLEPTSVTPLATWAGHTTPESPAGLASPVNRRRLTSRAVLIGTLCEDVVILCNPEHSGPSFRPEHIGLIGRPAQCLCS